MVRALLIAAALGGAIAISCYNPNVQSCQIQCPGPAGACPSGFTCSTEHFCVAEATPAMTCGGDAAVPVDSGSGSGSGSGACPIAPQGQVGCTTATPAHPTVAPCFSVCSPAESGSAAHAFRVGTWREARVGSGDFTTVRSLTGSGGPIWIGATRPEGGSAGSFTWPDGTAVIDADWGPSQPAMGSGLNCVIAGGAGWGVAPCDTTHDWLIAPM